ncbi:MAG: hypothetical protein N2258_04965 [Brevinematales bacterium]|nr:hypothetical protein [Brevinematales bacterium]
MPEEKKELLDDFLVDMDIETITIDKNDERVFLETEELDEEEIESSGDLSEFSKATGVEIENLNISGGGNITPPSDIKAETVNIYQQSPTVNVSGESIIEKSGGSGIISEGMAGGYSQGQPQQQFQQQGQYQPQMSGSGANTPPNITFENVTFEIKDASINVDKSEIKAEDISFSTESLDLSSIDSAELFKEPEEELVTISETDLNDIIDENTVDLDKLAEETESEFSSPEGLINTEEAIPEEITDKEEFGETIDEIEKVEEPSIPEQTDFTPLESEAERITEEPKGITEEDSIVSIDGNELDNLIYGGELSKYMEEPQKEEIKIEEPVEVVEEQPLQFEDTIQQESSQPSFVDESMEKKAEDLTELDNIEEIKLEEIPIEEIEVSSAGSNEIPIIEESPKEEETISKIEEENEELITPEAIIEEPLTKEEGKEEDFTFDLSVIPDVAEVEEDEPIALSLEELNNIEVSEESIEERFPSAESENIEIPVEELSDNVELEDSIKEPASLEVYGTDESGGLPEGIQIEGIDNIFEEPEPGKSFSESAGLIEDKLESLSPETKEELKTVLKYLDNLLEELPEDKIKEFAKSEYYDLYVKILDKLGI